MSKFWVTVVLLFLMNLVTTNPIDADSPLIEVEISRGIDPDRILVPGAMNRSFMWDFDNKSYTVRIAMDGQSYNKISDQPKYRRYNINYLRLIGDNGVKSLKKLIDEFNSVIPGGWSQEKKVNFVLAFVQNIPYKNDKTTGYDEFYKHPIETLAEKQGDCEDSSILFASILSGLDFEVILIDLPRHIAVGVKGDFRGGSFPYGGDKYFYCETTHPGWKLGVLPPDYKDIGANVIPITPKPVGPAQVTPRVVLPMPEPPTPRSAQEALEDGVDLLGKARYNEAIKSLQLALSGLESEQRAEAYIHLGMAEASLGLSGKIEVIENRLKDRFQQALRQNPNHEYKNKKYKKLFEEVRRESIGELTVSASLPQTEISIYGNEIKRKNLGAGTKTIKLFKGSYTVEGRYEEEFIRRNVKIEPGPPQELELDIPPIVVHEPVSMVSVGEIIPLTLSLTSDKRPNQVKIYYTYYDTNGKRLKKSNVKMLLSDRQRASSTWIYDKDLPRPQSAGSIQYYIEAEHENSLVREPKSKYKYHQISVIDETPPPPPPNQPPRIVLQNTIQTTNINQRISVKAKVTDDKDVKSVYLFYGFSYSNISPPEEYNWKKLTGNPLGIYSGYIPPQNAGGYVWYYIEAIDNEGEDGESKKKKLRIKRDKPYSPPKPEDKPSITVTALKQTSVYQGIWANYAWPSEVDGGSIFDWNRGDAINFTYLREGRTYQTLGFQLDYSYQNPSNTSATFQWGPALGKSPITFTLLTGIAGYRKPDSTPTTSTLTIGTSDESIYITPILGAGLKYYPSDRVVIETIGSLKLPSVFDETSLYHYEVGTRIYITEALNLKIGYSQWHLGDQNIARVQVGLGITF